MFKNNSSLLGLHMQMCAKHTST